MTTDNVRWSQSKRILVVSARRTLAGTLSRIARESPQWVVVVRSNETDPKSLPEGAAFVKVFYYVFTPDEMRAAQSDWSQNRPLVDALNLHETGSSGAVRGKRNLPGWELGQRSAPAHRAVRLDSAGEVTAVGSRSDSDGLPSLGKMRGGTRGRPKAMVPDEQVEKAGAEPSELSSLGPVRGARRDGAAKPETARGTLSAETAAEINVGDRKPVDFRAELGGELERPLAVSAGAQIELAKPIVAALTVETTALKIDGPSEIEVPAPTATEPVGGQFHVRAVKAGRSRLALRFRQGESEIGVLSLAVEVVDRDAANDKADATAEATPRDPLDDALTLLVDQRQENGSIFYEYMLHSEALNLTFVRLKSKPLLDRGNGFAATTIQFVEKLYERATTELNTQKDLDDFKRRMRALGASMSKELFDPEVAKRLWPLRDRIKVIQVTSWEPYIPWELVRLQNPDTLEVDDRFLAEYGLIRVMSGDSPPRVLPMKEWAYLDAQYPAGTHESVGGERSFFTKDLPKGGFGVHKIDAGIDAFCDAVRECDFDVLHVSCHAASQHDSIEDSVLVIGDEKRNGAAHIFEIDPNLLNAEAKLKPRRPLVFLNACESGRLGAVLTAWGGWPKTFLEVGAGAFIGSSWAVREGPAVTFATTFYKEMLAGGTLVEAAQAAREATKCAGDASWLAFKVYGHPRARVR